MAAEPEIAEYLEKSMQRAEAYKSCDLLETKMRRAFVLLVLTARLRRSKDAAEVFLPWGLTIYLISLHASASLVEGLRQALQVCVSHGEAWKFLRHLAELIEASYRTWWPGRGVAFASDNWQTERSWNRARLGQSNNQDTNVLLQVASRHRPHAAARAPPCTPHAHYTAHHMHTTCTLHARFMYATCTLQVHYMYTTCTPHAHYMHTTLHPPCTPHAHYM